MLAVIVIAAEPSNETPLMLRAVARVVAVDALPVRAPTNAVEVTEVSPAKVVTVAPRLTSVEPIVTLLFVREALPTFDSVFDAPLIVLLVNVSVVARPTSVSVLVGKVSVPELTILPITGLVRVLFVRVCVAVVPTTGM